MFIVAPRLASTPTIYGIYTITISVAIFLSYADFGFISSGYKYASERFASGEREEEIKVIGFVGFILFIFIVLYALIIMMFAVYPHLIIKNLKSIEETRISSYLLSVLALFAPTMVLPRILQIIFGTRLEDYIFQRISIVSSIIKISSVFYFFYGSKYDIVGYFLFSQTMNLMAALISFIVAKKRYNFDLGLLIKSFRFSNEIYDKTKKLAFSSLYLTGTWIIYYEIDTLIIGKQLGAKMVALYAVGLTLASFLRSIFGTLYTPFSARFNHFIGLKDNNGLKNLFIQVVILLMPIVVLPILCMILLMKPFILCWVGPKYIQSILIARFLVLSYIFSFISYPGGILLVAYQKIKMLYISSSILPVVYWMGVAVSLSSLGLKSFAIFKFLAFAVYSFFFLAFILTFLKIKLKDFMMKIFVPIIVPCLFIFGSLFFLNHLMPVEKDKVNLLIVIVTGGFVTLGSVCLYYLFSQPFRNYVNRLFKLLLLSLKSKNRQEV